MLPSTLAVQLQDLGQNSLRSLDLGSLKATPASELSASDRTLTSTPGRGPLRCERLPVAAGVEPPHLAAPGKDGVQNVERRPSPT